MTKGLESLSDLRLGYCGSDEQKERAYCIIEKELKEYEKMTRIKGTTSLDKAIENTLINACPDVANKLKALEIIRREPSMVCWQASHEDYEDYIDNTPEEQRYINSKEEYDLLKEVL